MKAYQITGLKDFMNRLLVSDVFDCFLLEQGTVTTFNSFVLDGRIQKEFYTKEEQESGSCSYEFSPWKEVRALFFQLIKGKRTPLGFKFVLLLLPEQMEKLLSAGSFDNRSGIVKYFTLTVKFNGNGITLVTGISTEAFLMDKTPERLWDEAFVRFMEKRGIAWEEASVPVSISSSSG